MSADAASRETGRDAFAALLETELTGAGNPVEEVLNFLPLDLGSKTPVLAVFAYGTPRRERFGMGTVKYHTWFPYNVNVYVKEADVDQSWTRLDVENTLDLIEKKIADVIADNRTTNPAWSDLRYRAGYQLPIVRAQIGGKNYFIETIQIEMEVHDA